jgi:hypothetical protein
MTSRAGLSGLPSRWAVVRKVADARPDAFLATLHNLWWWRLSHPPQELVAGVVSEFLSRKMTRAKSVIESSRLIRGERRRTALKSLACWRLSPAGRRSDFASTTARVMSRL